MQQYNILDKVDQTSHQEILVCIPWLIILRKLLKMW